MKSCMSIPLVATALLGMLATVGGCVPKADLDKANAMNRRMDEERKAALAQARELEGINQDLTTKLAAAEGTLKASEEKQGLLAKENDMLAATVKDLQAKLRAFEGMTPPTLPPLGPLPQALNEKLQKFAEVNPDLVEYLPKYGMVKLKADLTFDKGSDDVQAAAEQALGKFVEIVNSADAANFHVYVAGHTDDIPILKRETIVRHPNNWYLSAHRAVSVEQVLVKAGLAAERIGVMGFGEYHPVAPNAPGKKGNPANRRVEIWIVPPDRFMTISGA